MNYPNPVRQPEVMMRAVGRLSDPEAPVYPYGEAPAEVYRALPVAFDNPSVQADAPTYELRDATLAGNRGALQQLTERFSGYVASRAALMDARLPDIGHDAEDVLQEHWLAFLEALPGVRADVPYPFAQQVVNSGRTTILTALGRGMRGGSTIAAVIERFPDVYAGNTLRAEQGLDPMTSAEMARLYAYPGEVADKTHAAWAMNEAASVSDLADVLVTDGGVENQRNNEAYAYTEQSLHAVQEVFDHP